MEPIFSDLNNCKPIVVPHNETAGGVGIIQWCFFKSKRLNFLQNLYLTFPENDHLKG